MAIVMKRRKRWAGPTKAADGRRDEQGSIVLEAALTMPLLLAVLMAFIILIRLCAAQMALQSAASQSVRQIAAHIRPAELAVSQWSSPAPAAEPANLPLSGWRMIAAEAARWLPDPAGVLASSAIEGDWSPLVDAASTELGRFAVEPLLRGNADKAILEPERITLSRLSLPDLKSKQEPYITIEASYEFPMRVPILNKPIILREPASERVWVSDILPATDKETDSAEIVPIQLVSIQPSPLRPGHTATLTALTKPGAVASLQVQYKSGQSKAKNLGEALADEHGFVKWTWHVSGNTTPGLWELTATSASGEQASMHFQVEKKPKEGGG
ncbi:TadE/TadG family type IV pilus assembly protein [Paenibacillus sp. NPDC058071]|uniref:TadE/TadG family type IV pilus assembly protein n=1 Tax=Paenibacillus sp. NPDC058071 TaxID=3346326 RepID=UPI0036D9A2AB